MLTEAEHLLVCLAEECQEVAQRCHKALRFGLAEVQPGQPLTNAERIMEEAIDLRSVLEITEAMGIIPTPPDFSAKELARIRKRQKLARFMDYAAECGTLACDGLNPWFRPKEARPPS